MPDKPRIEIADQLDVTAKVFRLFSRDGHSDCRRSLLVRFDYGNDGWQVSFYGTGQRLGDAIQGYKPLTAVTADVSDLAIRAFEMLDALRVSGEMPSDVRPREV